VIDKSAFFTHVRLFIAPVRAARPDKIGVLWQITFTITLFRKFAERCGNCLFNTVTRLQPHIYRSWRHAKHTTCSPDTWENVVSDLHTAKPGLVFRTLLKRRSPPAIFRLVVSAWINPINRMISTGPFAHVLKETYKRRVPAVANGNSFAAIFCKIFGFGIRASALHPQPNSICRTDFTRSFVAMFNHVICITKKPHFAKAIG